MGSINLGLKRISHILFIPVILLIFLSAVIFLLHEKFQTMPMFIGYRQASPQIYALTVQKDNATTTQFSKLPKQNNTSDHLSARKGQNVEKNGSNKTEITLSVTKHLTKHSMNDSNVASKSNITNGNDTRDEPEKEGRKVPLSDTRADKSKPKEDEEVRRKKELFYELVTKNESKIFKTLLTAFAEAAPPNVTYFLVDGTLLGYYRHRGMVPWDDDVDILVKNDDKPVLEKALMSVNPDCQLITASTDMWKLHHRLSVSTSYQWKWPFLDLFFYKENQTHIWNIRSGVRHNKKDIFPLKKGNFMGLSLPVPKNTRNIIKELYGLDICKTTGYDHKREVVRSRSKVTGLLCYYLWDKFVFAPSYKNQTKASI